MMTATAQRMLESATKQFAEKGYSGVSMRSIAAATGTTQAAIYHHFPNKQALYDAVLAKHTADLTDIGDVAPLQGSPAHRGGVAVYEVVHRDRAVAVVLDGDLALTIGAKEVELVALARF